LIISLYGLPGTGKTTLLHDLVAAMANAQRFFIRDKAFEWYPGTTHWRGRNDLPITVIENGMEIPPPDEMPETGIFVFGGWDPFAIANAVVAYGNTTYVDDEIDSFARKEGWKENPLRGIVHEGRHQRNASGEICTNHIMGACRRPQNLHTDLTDITDQVYLFRVKGHNTKMRLINDSVVEGPEEWETVRNFPNFHCKHEPSGKFLQIKPLGNSPQNTSQHGMLPERK
jgi:hypothetical protein